MPPVKRKGNGGGGGGGGGNGAAGSNAAKDKSASGSSSYMLVAAALAAVGGGSGVAFLSLTGSNTQSGPEQAAPVIPDPIAFVPNKVEPSQVGVEPWGAARHVEQVDFNAPGAQQMLKNRGPNSSPLVVVNGLGGLEKLLPYGEASYLQSALREQSKAVRKARRKEPHIQDPRELSYNKRMGGAMNIERDMMSGTKTSDTALFSYWDNQMKWIGVKGRGDSGDGVPDQASWHYWKYTAPGVGAFFKAFEYASKPFLYWYSILPTGVLGTDARPILCKRLADTATEPMCRAQKHVDDPLAKNKNTGDTSEPGTVWANSAGVIAQAHYDRQQTVFVQLGGQKTWTFWAPQDLEKICMYPFSHPGSRQSAAAMVSVHWLSNVSLCRAFPSHCTVCRQPN